MLFNIILAIKIIHNHNPVTFSLNNKFPENIFVPVWLANSNKDGFVCIFVMEFIPYLYISIYKGRIINFSQCENLNYSNYL